MDSNITALLTFFGGAGLITIIQVIMNFLERKDDRQDQFNSVEIHKIATFKAKITSLNNQIDSILNQSHKSKNIKDIKELKVEIMSYISSWLLNVTLGKVRINDLNSSLHDFLKNEYSNVISDTINRNLSTKYAPYYHDAKHCQKLLKRCDIIPFKGGRHNVH